MSGWEIKGFVWDWRSLQEAVGGVFAVHDFPVEQFLEVGDRPVFAAGVWLGGG